MELFLLVEGDDEERFVDAVVRPLLADYSVMVWKHACATDKSIRKLVQWLNYRQVPYLYLTDLDDCMCIAERRAKTAADRPYVPLSQVVVVVREIEGWLIAGVPAGRHTTLSVPPYRNTEGLSKEEFGRIVGRRNRLVLIGKLLEEYDLAAAALSNGSLRYFIRRLTQTTAQVVP